MTAARSSGRPEAGAYFVRPASIAALPASSTWRGVGWSGSPTVKSKTRTPFAFSARAFAAIATVGDTSRRRARAASLGPVPAVFTRRSSSLLPAGPPRPCTGVPYFSLSRCSTTGGTRSLTRPPSWKTSFTSRDET